MPVPFNLLNMAMAAVGKQSFSYIKFSVRVNNDIGLDVATYDDPVAIMGQVQAVPRALFEKYGLDFQKNYLIFFVSKDVLDVERDVSGDQVQYASKKFQCLSKTDWYNQNGWVEVLTVEIP